jgi:hypothetical protein
MAKYRVTVQEVIQHVLDVEADTEDEAKELAILNVIEDDQAHFTGVEDRSVIFIYQPA